MLNTELYKKSRVYDFFMKSMGYEKSLRRFLDGVELSYTGPIKILDAGCGTGILGTSMLVRFPEATLLATDLEPNFLHTALENSRRWGIASHRIEVGLSNISDPSKVTKLDGETIRLGENSFDIICIGAVIGYSDCVETSLKILVNLLKPNGTLIDLDMNNSPAANFVSKRYDYVNFPTERIQGFLQDADCDVRIQKFGLKHVPATFTRKAIIAKKKFDETRSKNLASS